MKLRVQSAWVEEVDPTTEETIQGTKHSASIFSPVEESRGRRKIWRKSGEHNFECSNSECLGPMSEVISKHADPENILSIVAGKYPDNELVWKKCETSSTKHRVFFIEDNIITTETKTHISRTIACTSDDLCHPKPTLIIGQRTLPPSGGDDIQLLAHSLSFTSPLSLDRPYIFRRLGDEIPGLLSSGGPPDLHITFRNVRDWDSVLRAQGHFSSYDKNVKINISKSDIKRKRRVVYNFDEDCQHVINPGDDTDGEEEGDVEGRSKQKKPKFGIEIDAGNFAPLLLSVDGNDAASFDGPAAKRRRSDGETKTRNFGTGAKTKSFSIKLIGSGPGITGPDFRADLNVEFCVDVALE